MLILELAVQAVRGFSASARVVLRPGYVALKSPTQVPAPLSSLLTTLAYPEPRVPDTSFLAPGAKAGRAGFSLQGNDGSSWRLVRDLGGVGALHRQNRETNQFEVITQDQAELSQIMREVVGLPPRMSFEQLFAFTVGQLPTRAPRKPAEKKAAVRKMASALDQFTPTTTGTPEERLAALEKELRHAKSIAELQFRMDGVQSEAFKLEQRLKVYEELKAKVDAARAELASAPTPENLGLPADIVERVRRMPDEKKRYTEAVARLEQEKEDARIGEPIVVPSLWKDVRFTAAFGVALVILFGVGGLSAAQIIEGGARYLSLVSVIPATLAALVAIRYIEELQYASRELAKGEVFAQRARKLTDDYSLASTIAQAALDKAGASTADDFFTVMARRDALAPQVAELELEFADFEADPETPNLAAKVAGLKAEHEAINAKLMESSGGYVREARDVEREIARIKEEIAPPPPPPTVTGEFSALAAPPEGWDDPFPNLMMLGADLFATDVSTLWGVLHERTVQYLSALTDKRYHGVAVDTNGHATVDAPGRSVPVTEMPGRDLDLLYLSVRLTLIEKFSSQRKVPVVLEDAFGTTIDPAKQALFQRMLKHLGSLTQVLHVTGVSQTIAGADATVGL